MTQARGKEISEKTSEKTSEKPGQTRRLIHEGEPLLRQVSRAVDGASLHQDHRLNGLIDDLITDLITTAIATDGVGIAAPQVAEPLRLFIIASRPNARYPDAPQMEPTAMINPVLLDRSDAEVQGWEGCLSVPNCRAQVARAQAIWVEYLDRGGAVRRSHFQGFVARIFQHELDHLNGILFVDRVQAADCITEAEYQRQINS